MVNTMVVAKMRQKCTMVVTEPGRYVVVTMW